MWDCLTSSRINILPIIWAELPHQCFKQKQNKEATVDNNFIASGSVCANIMWMENISPELYQICRDIFIMSNNPDYFLCHVSVRIIKSIPVLPLEIMWLWLILTLSFFGFEKV